MIETIKHELTRRSLLIKCIAISLLLHIMLLYFFYKHPLSLYASSIFHKTRTKPTAVLAGEDISLIDKDKILAETFENITFLPTSMTEPYDLAKTPKSSLLAPISEDSVDFFAAESTFIPIEIASEEWFIQDQQDLASNETDFLGSIDELSDLNTPLLMSERLSDVLASSFEVMQEFPPELAYISPENEEPSYTSNDNDTYTERLPSLETPTNKQMSLINTENLSLLKNPSTQARVSANTSEWGKREIAAAPSKKQTPSITDRELSLPYALPPLASIDDDKVVQLGSMATWNDDFTVTVTISPPTEDSEYVFSLALLPTHTLSLEKISQNFYFLIDPSSSIDKHRFNLFKRSVLKSLSSLQEGDRFNIIVLDRKLTRLATKNLMFNLKSLHRAEEFLDKLSQANFITSVDVIESLEKVAALITESGQMHTALLLTNGQSSQGFQNQQKALKAYLEKNGSNLSLYAAAVGDRNNLVNLDMICNLSGGKLLYSDTNASFPRKFTQLVKSLKAPIAKDIRIKAEPINPKAGLSIMSASQHLPAMYADEPYIIMGKMERLSDFTLSIEARNDDEWITIQKTISFQQASVDKKLIHDWNKAEVGTQYQGFLKDPKAKYIKKAREILKETHGKAASQ